VAIGSGGPFALAAARVLAKHTKLEAKQIVEVAMAEAARVGDIFITLTGGLKAIEQVANQ